MYSVVIYSPDRHITYDPEIADRDGIGGGLTARLRLAFGLAERGCRTTVVANVGNREVRGGVEFIPLDEARDLIGDVVVFNSTGDNFNFSPALKLNIQAKLRMVWVNNVVRPLGLDHLKWDGIVTPSNFVRQLAIDGWGIPRGKLYVIHNGVPHYPPPELFPMELRNPFRLIYTSHPSKGLSAALQLLRLLRSHDKRFELLIFGGHKLWGQENEPFDPPEGVEWHGLVGQERLARELRKASFAIHLQDFQEPFGISLAEAMSAGCIVIASRVGAFPELVRNGHDGILLEGIHDHPETLARAAELIKGYADNCEPGVSIRKNAAAAPLRWPVISQAWMEVWNRLLSGENDSIGVIGNCRECSGRLTAYSDGCRCGECGMYLRDSSGCRE
jgi:glycosyltransferase involved in cell wall biosynthesis